MTKKLFRLLIGFVALVFLFGLAANGSLFAQEKQEEQMDVMDMELEDLLNVEITTAGKQAEKISEIPASVVVVTREDIEKYGYQSLAEVLGNIPGLYMTDDYYSKKLGVRGFWTEADNRNIIFLVNNIQQKDDLYSAFPMEDNVIPVEAIDRIEVVRGPMSVIYGAGAFFGVINIITNQFGDDKPTSQVSASYGSENTQKLAVRVAGKENDFKYSFIGSYFSSDGLELDLGDVGGSDFAGISTENKLDTNEKYFNFSGEFKGFTFDASYSEKFQGLIFLLPFSSENMDKYHKSTRISFGYKKDLSEKVNIDARFVYFLNRWEYDYRWLMEEFYGIEDDSTTAYKAELNLFYKPSPKLNLTFGVNYHSVLTVLSEIDVPLFGLGNVEYSLVDDEAIVTQSVYMQLNYKFSDRFKIVAGARLEQMPEYVMEKREGDPVGGIFTATQTTYSQADPEFIPRLAAIFSPNENNYFKLLYGKAINRPSFFQNQDLFGGLDSLESETIQTLELNYIGSLSSNFSVSLSIFHNMLENLIYRTQLLIGGEYLTYHANVGEMTTTGVELTLTAKPSKSFHIEFSGTYQDTKDKREGFEDIEPGYSPKFLGYLKAAYFVNKDISLAVTGNYVDEMETFWDASLGGRLGEKVDSYFLINANLRVRNLFGTKMFANFRASNLLDEEIRYPATSNNDWASLGTIGRGFSFLFTLGCKF